MKLNLFQIVSYLITFFKMLWLIKRLTSIRKIITVLLCAQAQEQKPNLSNLFCVFRLNLRYTFLDIH